MTVVSQYQLALFPIDFSIENSSLLGINIASLDLFDKKTLNIVPLQDSEAPEIPRVEISNSNESFHLQISKAKLMFYWANKDRKNEYSIPDNWEKQIETVLRLCNLDEKQFSRVGWITRFYVRNSSPDQAIHDNILQQHIPANITAFKTILTIASEISGVKSNKHITLGSGFISNNPENKGILFQTDFNTHQSNEINWSLPELIKYVKEAQKQSAPDNIFQDFFPAYIS